MVLTGQITPTDWEMVSGDNRTIDVTCLDADGNIIDLTGATIDWVMKARDGTTEVTKSTASGITITGAAAGTCQLALDPADTDALEGTYMHEMQVTTSTSEIHTVMRGRVVIIPDLVT